MEAMSGIVKECWYKTPAARLSAFRIKKSLMKIVSSAELKTTAVSDICAATESSPLVKECDLQR